MSKISTPPNYSGSCTHQVYTDITVALGRSGSRGDASLCPICYDSIDKADLTYRHDACGIAYHYHCLQEHFMTVIMRKGDQTCPVCRGAFVYDPARTVVAVPHVHLNAEWHDIHRIASGNIPREFSEFNPRELGILKRTFELSMEKAFSPKGALILYYAQICHLLKPIHSNQTRLVMRGNFVNELSRIYHMSLEGELDDVEMLAKYNVLDYKKDERVAQITAERRLRLHRVMETKISSWKGLVESAEQQRRGYRQS